MQMPYNLLWLLLYEIHGPLFYRNFAIATWAKQNDKNQEKIKAIIIGKKTDRCKLSQNTLEQPKFAFPILKNLSYLLKMLYNSTLIFGQLPN